MPNPRGRILVCEDDADTRELITFILKRCAFEVVSADSPNEALAIAKGQPFDLFLVDSWMRGMSGIGLCKALREFDLKTPVLFYSGAGLETDKEAARLAGAQGYLVKPVDADDFIAEVVRLIAEAKIIKSFRSAASAR